MTRDEKIDILRDYCSQHVNEHFCGVCCPICVGDDNDICKPFMEYTDAEIDRCLGYIEQGRVLEPLGRPAQAHDTVRGKVLGAAVHAVCGHRATDYGTPEDNFGTIAKLWSIYKGTDFTPTDVAMMMALLKVARIKSGATEDSFVDLAGYAACAAECAEKEK